MFKPNVFKIAISLVLFFINIVRPEIILNAATIIIKVSIINMTFLSTVFDLEIFPSDIYFLEKLPSEINLFSIFIIFILSLIVSAIASYIPARHISKMKTFRALKYE